MLDHTCHITRAAVNNDNIGVFSFFQRTDTVSDADVLGRVDGYGAECVIFVHTGFDGEPCAERQVVERSDRSVRDDGDVTSGFCENKNICIPTETAKEKTAPSINKYLLRFFNTPLLIRYPTTTINKYCGKITSS